MLYNIVFWEITAFLRNFPSAHSCACHVRWFKTVQLNEKAALLFSDNLLASEFKNEGSIKNVRHNMLTTSTFLSTWVVTLFIDHVQGPEGREHIGAEAFFQNIENTRNLENGGFSRTHSGTIIALFFIGIKFWGRDLSKDVIFFFKSNYQ